MTGFLDPHSGCDDEGSKRQCHPVARVPTEARIIFLDEPYYGYETLQASTWQTAVGGLMGETKPIRRVVWGRRFLAATVVVPPSMAERLNTDALAVLAVIRDEAKATGRCDLSVARIAERANIGRAKARAAIRLAESLGEFDSGMWRLESRRPNRPVSL